MVVRARRSAAQRRRAARSRWRIRDEVIDLEEAGIRDHPDRRAGAARGPAAAQGRVERLSRLGGGELPPRLVRRARRDADPHPHVLLGVQRHHRRDRGAGRRRDLDRDRALQHGAARCLHDLRYPNEIGPGVYDIHSPRCPSVDEMAALLDKAMQRLSPDQLWVNPDCGLKTRKWEEVRPALINMVHAARRIRGSAK